MKPFQLKSIHKIFLLLLFLVMQSVYAAPADDAFNQLADEYFDTLYFPANPSLAVLLGEHKYDNNIEDYSKSGIKNLIERLQQFSKRVEAIHSDTLDLRIQGDRDLVLNNIRSQLLTLQEIRPYEKNPDYYSSGITNAASVLIARDFAPQEQRLRSLIAREKLMPAVLANARKNLKNPPKIYTEIALDQMPGIISFFQNDVPLAFTNVTDMALNAEFAETNAAVISALQSYQLWMQTDLLPRSNGDFRIGAENFLKKLQYDEMVDLSLQQLLDIGWANLRDNQREYKKVLDELSAEGQDPTSDTKNQSNHPAPSDLLNTFAASFDSIIQFIQHKKIITIPSDVRPTMIETPPFLRATVLATMDSPGPFETVAKEAFFSVTLPDPNWDQAQIDEYMSFFNYPNIKVVSIHETYPGHYIQFLWMHQVQGRVRKILGANTNAEGWAHYSEQMMLDEGYGQSENSHEAKVLRLNQLRNALQRNARYIVGIEMHTGNMTMDQAVDFFVKEGYQSKIVGTVEMKRGTSDPTYLYYTLGKLQIIKLRNDLAAKQGNAFSLQKFHDAFMQQGYPPFKIVRRELMQDDSSTL